MSYTADRPFSLFFVRHGVTEPNFRGFRCGGDLDIPLMDIGGDPAHLLAKQIERMNLRVGMIIAGSLIRTRQTASIMSGVLGNLPIEVEPLINERRLGQWNNRPIAVTEGLLAAKVAPPGRGSEGDFTGRIELALDRIRPHLEKRPLLVSSKGVGRILNQILGGTGRMNVANGEIVEFTVYQTAASGAHRLKVVRPYQA